MINRLLLCLLQATFLVFCTTQSAQALSLIDFDLHDLVRLSESAFVIEITEESTLDRGAKKYHVEVVNLAYGDPPANGEIKFLGGLPVPEFDVGARYFVFFRQENRFEPVIGYRYATYRIDDLDQLRHMSGTPVQIVGRLISKDGLNTPSQMATLRDTHGFSPSHDISSFIKLVKSIKANEVSDRDH